MDHLYTHTLNLHETLYHATMLCLKMKELYIGEEGGRGERIKIEIDQKEVKRKNS